MSLFLLLLVLFREQIFLFHACSCEMGWESAVVVVSRVENVVCTKSQRRGQDPGCLKARLEWLESMTDSQRKPGSSYSRSHAGESPSVG